MRRGLYQGWVGWRNLGDEVMFEACRRCLPTIRWTPIPFDDIPPPLPLSARVRSRYARQVAGLFGGSVAMLGGGTILNRIPAWLEQYRRLCRTVGRPVPLFSPGVADPSFWSAAAGWRDTRAEWRTELARLPQVGVRGPLSKRLLDEVGCRNVVVAGDPALTFHRGATPAPPAGRRRVAVNAGRAHGEVWGSEDRMIATLAAAVRRLVAAGYDVRVFPAWDRDEVVCREVARAAGLPDDAVDPLLLDADTLLQYLDGFDVVVSIKLHAAVLAAAAGVPFVAVEYQPKVRDFTESIGWGRFTFRSDTVEATDVERAVREIHDDLAAVRQHLDARVRELVEGFRAHARQLEALLLAA
ncbi:MAG: polysaccharide pyruvyl transferase family protein [bacterium]